MSYRLDHRTQAEFEATIKRATALEAWLAQVWKKDLEHCGYSVKLTNNGVDNSGAFVKKASSAPDFKVSLQKKGASSPVEFLAEIKSNPGFSKSTFKVDALESCIKYDATLILFFNTDTKTMEFEKNTSLEKLRYAYLSPCLLLQLLDCYKAKSYGSNFNGGKPSIQILEKDYSKWFAVYPLSYIY